MKALLTRTSAWNPEVEKLNRIIEINTISELLELMRAEGDDLIITEAHGKFKNDVDFEIEVYDDYRE
jgi:hypothetical protein